MSTLAQLKQFTNQDIGERLHKTAVLLELSGANPFRCRAYHNAARTIADLTTSLREQLLQGQDLTTIAGIGKDIASQIQTLLATGTTPLLTELEAQLPAGLLDLLQLPGLGPKKVRAIWQSLDITSLADLKKAAEEDKIAALPGFGKKTQANILHALVKNIDQTKRYLIAKAKHEADLFIDYLNLFKPHIIHVEPAGSLRRGKETIGDIDLLIAAEKDSNKQAIIDYILRFDRIDTVLSKTPGRTTVILISGLQVDLKIFLTDHFGAALAYFTGSQAHNIAMRRHAQSLGFKLNEYGLFRDEQLHTAADEKDIYQVLGLTWIPPELREDRGEILASQTETLPNLVRINDIQGNLHCHTTESDGQHNLLEMIELAKASGLTYLAITDHSKSLTVANGLTEQRLLAQVEQIRRLNAQLTDFELLAGSEVDIDEEGNLDFSDDVLKELDVVIIAIHSQFQLSRAQQTNRLLKAMDNPYVNFVAHPTGRLLTKRPAYDIDIEKVIEHAAQRKCFLEINANPYRLDLNDTQAKYAKELGIKITINTDAHQAKDFHNLGYGISQARRAWLTKNDVINTIDRQQIRQALASTRLK